MGTVRPTVHNLGSMRLPAMSTPHQPRPSPSAWLLDGDDAGGVPAAASSGRHFLDECRMCGRYLPRNRDIYMYKGDKPFCSEDCREEQIRIDEHKERANRRRRANVAAAACSSVVKPRTGHVAVGAL